MGFRGRHRKVMGLEGSSFAHVNLGTLRLFESLIHCTTQPSKSHMYHTAGHSVFSTWKPISPV